MIGLDNQITKCFYFFIVITGREVRKLFAVLHNLIFNEVIYITRRDKEKKGGGQCDIILQKMKSIIFSLLQI